MAIISLATQRSFAEGARFCNLHSSSCEATIKELMSAAACQAQPPVNLSDSGFFSLKEINDMESGTKPSATSSSHYATKPVKFVIRNCFSAMVATTVACKVATWLATSTVSAHLPMPTMRMPTFK